MEGDFVFNNYKYLNPAGIYLETLFANLTIVPFPSQELLAFTRDSYKLLARLLEIPGEDISPTPNFL